MGSYIELYQGYNLCQLHFMAGRKRAYNIAHKVKNGLTGDIGQIKKVTGHMIWTQRKITLTPDQLNIIWSQILR